MRQLPAYGHRDDGLETVTESLISFRPVRTTVITDAAQDSAIVQQIIFSPVLACLPFATDDEAPGSPTTPYTGWPTNVFSVGRASREIQAGCLWIDDHTLVISEMPYGV